MCFKSSKRSFFAKIGAQFLLSRRMLEVPPPTQNGYLLQQQHHAQPHSPGHQVRKMGAAISPSTKQQQAAAAAAAAAATSASSVLSSMAAVQLKATNLRVGDSLQNEYIFSLRWERTVGRGIAPPGLHIFTEYWNASEGTLITSGERGWEMMMIACCRKSPLTYNIYS